MLLYILHYYMLELHRPRPKKKYGIYKHSFHTSQPLARPRHGGIGIGIGRGPASSTQHQYHILRQQPEEHTSIHTVYVLVKYTRAVTLSHTSPSPPCHPP